MKKILKIFILTFLISLLHVVAAYAATDIYTVQKGDSLWIIAKKYQVGLSEIISANPQFKNPSMIYPGDKITVPLPDPGVKSIEEEVVALVNKERTSRGLKPLSINWEVARVARYKSEDMLKNNYFSHTSPVYGSPFDMMKKFNISYTSAAENIAKGQKTADSVVKSWMNSEGHRQNILNSTFTETGVGYVSGNGTTYWTQMFIK